MNGQFPQQSSNTTILKCLCGILPAALLSAAHWFPWERVRGKTLRRLETYSIGTAAIVGTAGLAILLSDGTREDHATMLGIATASAGGLTFAAYAIDHSVNADAKIANLEAQIRTLTENADL